MKQKDFLIILVPLFILTVLWVIFNIYHNYVTSTIKDPLSIQIIPIVGKFDTQVLNRLKGRERINPLYEISSQISPTPTPTEEELISPEETGELELEQIEEVASPSGLEEE